MDELTDEFNLIGRIVRDSNNEVLIKRGTYWNVDVLDIRWFNNDKPSRKGIRLNAEEAKILYDILRREFNEEKDILGKN